MKRSEMVVIALLLTLVLAWPVLLIASAFGVVQGLVLIGKYETTPYTGTAKELYAQYEAQLYEAAEILWEHPEFFENYRVPGEDDGSFPLHEIRRGKEVEHPFTEEEWQTLLALTEQRWLRDVWYYWGIVPVIDFGVRTEVEGYSPSLLYIRRAELPEDDVRRTMSYHLHIYEAYEWLNADWCVTYYGKR